MWSVCVFFIFILVCQIEALPRRNISNSNGELVSLFVIFRHGDRGPKTSFPDDPFYKPEYWPQGYGELTAGGIRRHYKLGQWLRERYSNFLPELYSPKDVYVYSTDIDRTLMSASANLAGLFAPKDQQVWNENLLWQPIPIHTRPEDADDVVPDRDTCPNYAIEYKKVKKNKYFRAIKEKYAELFEKLAKKTNMEVDDIKHVRRIRDIIYVYEHYNLSYVPSWAYEFDRKTLDDVTGIYFQRKSYTDLLKQYLIGPFFHRLTTQFDKVTNNGDYKKLYMVSAHESSVAPVLDAMGAFDLFPPDFAATVIFELRKSDDNYFINAFYKQINEVKQLSIIDCGSNCDYAKFKKVMGKFIIDYQSWREICGRNDDNNNDDD